MDAKELAKPENLDTAQQYIDFVKNNLEPLAQHLKVSVEWLWNILVMQARVEAIVYLVVCLAMFATTSGLMILFYKSLKKAKFKSGYGESTVLYVDKKSGESKDAYEYIRYYKDYHKVKLPNQTNVHGYVTMISGFAALFMILTSVVTTGSSLKIIVTGLVNPEFRAIEKIVEYAKPNVPTNQDKKSE